MNKFIILITVLLVIVSCSLKEESSKIEQKIQGVESSLVEMGSPSIAEQFHVDHIKTQKTMSLSERMAHYHVPGVSIAVINNNEIEWAKAYGVSKAGSDTPLTTEILFEAASTTKLITSVIALNFVEQEQFDLDEDINRYLKSFKIPENDFTRKEKVTLRRLLIHQSGLNRPDGGFGYQEGSVPSLIQVLKGESPAENKAAVVEYVPGTQHQYSNLGYLVIQLLLEDVTGKPYSQIVKEIIFAPARMKNSTVEYPFKPEIEMKVIKPHDQEGNAHENGLHPTALAHGNLVTTPADLALFAVELMRAYQGRSTQILSQKTVQGMFEVEFAFDPTQFFGMTAQGLGVFLMGEGENLYFLYLGHNSPGATSLFIASPATGKGAVIMTNGFNGLQLSMEILAALVNEYDWPNVQ